MMKKLEIINTPVNIDLGNFNLHGEPVIDQKKAIRDVMDIFKDKEALKELDGERLVYSVQAWLPINAGTTGGLFFGVSTIMPGKVGNEFFMTKGHFHAVADRAEFYWGVKGEGMLILMDRNRKTWAERVFPGSLHYIPGETAHRLANTGDVPLIVGACWPSDAGYDYEEIAKNGFSGRLVEINGKPALIEA